MISVKMIKDLPTEIRGHHLPALVRGLTLEEWGAIFTIDGYVDSPNHPFVKIVYETLSALRANPEHILLVNYGCMDFICQNCPKQNQCFPQDKESISVYAKYVLDKYYLQEPIFVGEKFSVREICNAINPAKWVEENHINEKIKGTYKK